MSKTILTIGFELASEHTRQESFSSKASLLDWDIILFKPGIDYSYKYGAEDYQGKPCLNDTSSFALKEATEHWRREIKQAVEMGKTVIVFFLPWKKFSWPQEKSNILERAAILNEQSRRIALKLQCHTTGASCDQQPR